ncbi:MAG: hypothetical protein ACR2N1_11095 [Rubripirellula sp.]
MKYLFGIGAIIMCIGLAVTAYYQFHFTQTRFGLAVQKKQVVVESRDESSRDESSGGDARVIAESPDEVVLTVPRWFQRDSEAEEVLGLVKSDLSYNNAYAFKWKGGILCTTIYQTDGQVLFSTDHNLKKINFGIDELSAFGGRLLVTITSDGQVKVIESTTIARASGSRITSTWNQPKVFQLDQCPVKGGKFSGSTIVSGNRDWYYIMFGDCLFMELRWLDEDVDLDAKTKNRIWWDIEHACGDIANFSPNDTSMEKIKRISKDYGIAYGQARAIYDQGKTASWRTLTPPESEIETPPASLSTP